MRTASWEISWALLGGTWTAAVADVVVTRAAWEWVVVVFAVGAGVACLKAAVEEWLR